jgi:hypothetical protein
MSDASDEMVFGLDYRAQILALGLTPEELAERTMQTVEWARAFLCVPNTRDDRRRAPDSAQPNGA